MIPVLVIVCILIGVLILASDIKSMFAQARASSENTAAEPSVPRGWCHTCGKETDGPYYCSEACYPPEEEQA